MGCDSQVGSRVIRCGDRSGDRRAHAPHCATCGSPVISLVEVTTCLIKREITRVGESARRRAGIGWRKVLRRLLGEIGWRSRLAGVTATECARGNSGSHAWHVLNGVRLEQRRRSRLWLGCLPCRALRKLWGVLAKNSLQEVIVHCCHPKTSRSGRSRAAAARTSCASTGAAPCARCPRMTP